MDTVIVFSILFGLLAVYVIVSMYINHRDTEKEEILAIEAGPLHEADPETLKTLTVKSRTRNVRLPDGTIVSTSAYQRIRIVGNCMRPRNILDGEEWLVERINPMLASAAILHPGDVLLIRIEDKGICKIREFEAIESQGSICLKTFYYNLDGSRHYSSRPHKWENVVGRVKYNF